MELDSNPCRVTMRVFNHSHKKIMKDAIQRINCFFPNGNIDLSAVFSLPGARMAFAIFFCVIINIHNIISCVLIISYILHMNWQLFYSYFNQRQFMIFGIFSEMFTVYSLYIGLLHSTVYYMITRQAGKYWTMKWLGILVYLLFVFVVFNFHRHVFINEFSTIKNNRLSTMIMDVGSVSIGYNLLISKVKKIFIRVRRPVNKNNGIFTRIVSYLLLGLYKLAIIQVTVGFVVFFFIGCPIRIANALSKVFHYLKYALFTEVSLVHIGTLSPYYQSYQLN